MGESLPGTIRGDFSIEVGRNICHGSDSVENAEKEIALWFKDDDRRVGKPQLGLVSRGSLIGWTRRRSRLTPPSPRSGTKSELQVSSRTSLLIWHMPTGSRSLFYECYPDR